MVEAAGIAVAGARTEESIEPSMSGAATRATLWIRDDTGLQGALSDERCRTQVVS
jgi:hypothetical protein